MVTPAIICMHSVKWICIKFGRKLCFLAAFLSRLKAEKWDETDAKCKSVPQTVREEKLLKISGS